MLCPTFVPMMQHFPAELVHPKVAKSLHPTKIHFVHVLELNGKENSFKLAVRNGCLKGLGLSESSRKIHLLPELCEYTELWPTQTNDQLGKVGSSPGGLNACTMPLRYSVVDGCR